MTFPTVNLTTSQTSRFPTSARASLIVIGISNHLPSQPMAVFSRYAFRERQKAGVKRGGNKKSGSEK